MDRIDISNNSLSKSMYDFEDSKIMLLKIIKFPDGIVYLKK